MAKVTDPELLAKLQRIVADAPAPAPAPASSPQSIAPEVKTKPVRDPELLAKLQKLAEQPAPMPRRQPQTALQPTIARQEDEVPATVEWARSAASGDFVANLPSLTGVRGMQALEEARRTRGQSAELRKVDDSFVQGPIQFATNVLGDAVGIAASAVSLPVEAAVLGGKVAGKFAGAAATDIAGLAQRAGADQIADWLVGSSAAKALAKQQERGQFATQRAAGETVDLAKEAASGVAFGLSPAAFEAGQTYKQTGDTGKAAEAAWEAFKAYPLASLMPINIGARAAMRQGGTPIVRDGMEVQTPRGQPVVLNRVGQAAFEPATRVAQKFSESPPTTAAGQWLARKAQTAEASIQPLWQRLVFDVVPNDTVKAQRAQAAAVRAGRQPSPAVANIADTVQRHNVLRDIDAELTAGQFANATLADKFAAVEGRLEGAEQIYTAPVTLDGAARQSGQALGDVLVAAGMDPALAQQAVPFTLFEGVRATQRGMFAAPVQALDALRAKLESIADPALRKAEVDRLAQVVEQQMRDPVFLAAADQAWSLPQGGYKWVPGQELRQRAGYIEAFKKAQEADAASGRQVFQLETPELGQLQRDYTAALYDKLVDDVASSPDGRLRVMQALRSQPIARLQANPNAAPHVQALAAWSNSSPARRKFVDAINQASLEIADNLGVDPVVIAKNYDRYLSRAFTDHLTAQARLVEKLGLLDDGKPFAIGFGQRQSNRFRRKLSQGTSGDRLVDMAKNGDIDLQTALAGTADQMMATAQLLFRMNEWHKELSASGMVSDTAKPGWVYTGSEKAAPRKQAASNDPYNFLYGKLADKYVHPQVAKQMGLARDAMRKAWPITQTLRLMLTSMNLPIYPIRNFVQDHGYMFAATGLSPASGKGRQLRLSSAADIDRFAADKLAGKPPTVSTMMLEAIEQGVVDMDSAIADLAQVPPALRSAVFRQAQQIGAGAVKQTDPIKALEFISDAALALKAGAEPLVELGGVLKRTVLSPRKELGAAAIKAWEMTKLGLEQEGLGKIVGPPNVFLSALNNKIARSSVMTMMALAEQSRRLYAYRVGREHLNLPPERAALLAQHVAYGVEQPSPAMNRLMTTPVGQVMLPPFLRFGAWQAKNYSQRAINDPALYAAWALRQGLSAANEQDILQTEGKSPLNTRLAQAFLQRNSAPDIGLANAKDVADVLRPIAPRLADNIGRRANYLTVSLRDVGGYSSFLSNMDPSVSGLPALVQFNPFARYIATLTTPTLQDPLTGIPRLPEGDPDFGKRAVALAQLTAAMMFPQYLFSAVGQASDVAKSLATGQPVVTGKTGKEANAAELTRYFLAPLGMTALDQVALSEQLRRRIEANKLDVAKKAAAFSRSLPLTMPQQERGQALSEQAINSAAKQKQIELAVAVAYGADPIAARKARETVESLRKQAVATARQGGDASAVLSRWWDNDTVLQLIAPVQAAIEDLLDDLGDDDDSDQTDTPD